MKKFVLGLGAQRAGTTFLHHTLSKLKNSVAPLVKEMHIWDALEIELCKKWRIYNPEYLSFPNKELLKKLVNKDEMASINNSIIIRGTRMDFQNSPYKYFDYFNYLLENFKQDLTFDITPEYIGLKSETLNMINENFANKNIDCKFIIIIRDPVERCWSAVKSKFKKSEKLSLDQIRYTHINEAVDPSIPINESMIKYSKSADAIFRTDYKKIIERLKKLFDKEKYLILIYEDLEKKDIFNKLGEFLDIDFSYLNTNLLGKKINASNQEKLDENLRKEIAPLFIDTYRYCAKELPETKKYWQGYKYIDL